jgi:membrane-associated protein
VDFLQTILEFLGAHVYLVALVSTTIDATGFPFPGRIVLIFAGALAASGNGNVLALIAVAALGAVIGDHLWFVLGRWGGDRPLRVYCRLSLGSRRCVDKANDYYRRYGGLTVVIGRFFAGVRIFASPLAGAGLIPYWKFLLYEIAGAVLWSALFVGGGYMLGGRGVQLLQEYGWIAALVALAAVLGLLAPVGIRLWRRARHGPATLGEAGGERPGHARA